MPAAKDTSATPRPATSATDRVAPEVTASFKQQSGAHDPHDQAKAVGAIGEETGSYGGRPLHYLPDPCEGKISRRRNNRSGVQALGRESQNGNSGKDLRSTALYSVCPNFVAAFWLAVVEDWEVLMVDLRTSFPALGVSARAFFWLCFLCAGAVCTAQTGTSLRGTITDPSGALVPNATVILENVGTNASRTVTTNSEGVYQILQVAPGPYRLTAELAGFKPILTENIQLLINTPANLDLKFELLGQVTNVQVLFI